MTDIADPTPADDIIDHQERVEAVIDQRIAESATDAGGTQQPVPLSFLLAYLESDANFSGPTAWNPSGAVVIGSDLSIVSGDHSQVHVATAGVYVIALALSPRSTVDGEAQVGIFASGQGFWDAGGDVSALKVTANSTHTYVVTFPPAYFDVGSFPVSIDGGAALVGASATLDHSQSYLYMVRIA